MNTPTETKKPYTVLYHDDALEVRENTGNGEKSLYAIKAFQSGEIISPFSARSTSAKASYLSVQTGEAQHIQLWPEHLQYCNHSCNPNAFFDTEHMLFTAIKDVLPGDELAFFYPSTEWEMTQPFACHCGSENCLGSIQGAKHVPQNILAHYRLSPFIVSKLNHV